MKVLMINSVAGVGSTGKICVDLCEELERKNVETCLVYGRKKYDTSKKTYKMGTMINNYWHVLETRLFDNHGYSSRLATDKLIKFLKAYNPDIIHLHNLHGYYINISKLFDYLSKDFNGKVIFTLHDTWLFSGHSATLETSEILSEESNINDYPKTWFFNFYERNLKRKKKDIIKIPKDKLVFVTPSNWLYNMVQSTFLNNYEARVINNGINQNIFKPIDVLKKQKKIILFVTNIWSEDKGIRIVNIVAEKLNTFEYEIVLVGKVPSEYKLSSNIVHVGQTRNMNELAEVYSSASVYVNPTYRDNFPTTNLEALSCGVPVVTFDTGGCGEVIDKNEKYGKIVKQDDVDDLIFNIKKYSQINKSKEIRGYAKKYSKENMIKNYMELIEEISKNN